MSANGITFLIIIGLIIYFWPKGKSKKRYYKSSKKRTSPKVKINISRVTYNKSSRQIVFPEERRYMATNVPTLALRYNIFLPSFLQQWSSYYIETGKSLAPKAEDLLTKSNQENAFIIMNHCLRVSQARYSAVCKINKAPSVEVKFIDFSVFRSCRTGCPKVPKNKRYKLTDDIPIYPCEDCKEEDICLFAYDYRW